MSKWFINQIRALARTRHGLAVLGVIVTGALAPAVSAQDMGNRLATNQSLSVNQFLTSTNKAFRLVMQGDGNLALYRQPSTYIWGTGATAGRRAVMQADGNLCTYAASGAGAWCNGSNGPNGDYYLMVRDSGDLEIYRGSPAAAASSALVWTTGVDVVYYSNKYADLKNAFGTDARRLMEHWIMNGRFEGRSPRNGVDDLGFRNANSVNLETMFYANKYPDLKNAFGYDAQALYSHWMNSGRAEGRVPNKATEDFLAPAARSANGQSSMRNSDWLHVNEYLRSPGGGYIAILQNDLNLAIYQTGSPATASGANHRWNYNNSQPTGQTGPGVLRMQTDGHFCVYKGTVNAQGQGFKCVPAGAGGPIGRYFLTLQDDGNLVIYKGAGPTDRRGWIWDRITTAPSSGFDFRAAVESVINTAASTVSNTAVGIGNSAAQVTVSAANDFAREVVSASNLVTTTIVSTAGKVADTTTTVAVTVGRGVEQGGRVVGAEIIRNGEIVGYAVVDLATSGWNYLKGNCGTIGRKAFPIGQYFQSAQQLSNNIRTFGTFANQAELQAAADRADACIEQIQDGFYCAVPAAAERFVSKVGDMPGNLLNLSTRVFNEGKTQICLDAGVATLPWGGAGLPVCAVSKVVVTDATKAVACFSAAMARDTVKKVAPQGTVFDSFPSKAVCEGIGELAYQAAEKALLKNLTAELQAAAKDSNNTVAIVADQIRTVYKMAGHANKYQELVNALKAIPECN